MSEQGRGGAVVGRLDDLDPIEAGAVIFLRLWAEERSECDRAGYDVDLLGQVGAGSHVLETLEQICLLCARHGRRPLMRHALNCNCLGADENCFAQMIGAAADGGREDAIMIASLIVRHDVAPALAALSQTFGLALRQMSMQKMSVPRGAAPNPEPRVLH